MPNSCNYVSPRQRATCWIIGDLNTLAQLSNLALERPLKADAISNILIHFQQIAAFHAVASCGTWATRDVAVISK